MKRGRFVEKINHNMCRKQVFEINKERCYG